MAIDATIVFTDLHGSTAIFERLGNAKATEAVTQLTAWIGKLASAYKGFVVKTMGDGVMLMFTHQASALAAMVEMQRQHARTFETKPVEEHLRIRVGMSTGSIEVVDSDCFGDAVNVAARLCDLAGPNQIWASSSVVTGISPMTGVRFRSLGSISIRGRSEPCVVHQIEWVEDEITDFVTMHATMPLDAISSMPDALGCELKLTHAGVSKVFHAYDMPVNIGRVRTMEFVVDDLRVSRTHARLDWRNGSVVFVDASSYGSWVRFRGDLGAGILLRRNECVLHGVGAISLGASFVDASAPKITFEISANARI